MGAQKTDHVAALRAALRGDADGKRARLSVEDAAAPLLDAFGDGLLRFCNKLARGAPRARLEGEDLAVLAWEKVLRYLAGANGDRVQSDEHFGRLLRTIARSRLLDILDRCPEDFVELDAPLDADGTPLTRAELLADPGATPEESLLPKGGTYLTLVEELFTDEERFRKTYRQKNQRHPRNYKALVLYHLALHWREEVGREGAEDPRAAAFIRQLVELLGIPAALWGPVERAAAAPDAVLLAAVNAVCGTNLREPATLKVLRHEMNRFAAQCAGRTGG